jgi:hypothetical protein
MLKLLKSPKACRGVQLVTCCVVPRSLSIKSESRGSSQPTPCLRNTFQASLSQAIFASMYIGSVQGLRIVK